jgi:two-component system response regulator GlrR
VRLALEKQSLSNEVKRLKAKVAEHKGIEAMIGTSPALMRVTDQIRTIAGKNITVIIHGESGTGKELAARALHQASARRERPFVAVNCAAIPESLLENELFGHVKGAFTGASAHHRGLFEEAHGGTIFLDEIGDIPASLQAKLLRVLQEQEFKKVGGTRDVRVDVRLITATNKDLQEAVSAGRFREDLFYRINVVPIRMPSLRERLEDVPILAHYFRNVFNDELSIAIKGFDDAALAQMVNYTWPGNVRELRNRVKMAMVMAKGPMVGVDDLALEAGGDAPAFPAFRDAKEQFERDYVVRALKVCAGNVKKAALMAGRDRSTFYDLLKKHAIDADSFRELFATPEPAGTEG